jgi:hypothetical protein
MTMLTLSGYSASFGNYRAGGHGRAAVIVMLMAALFAAIGSSPGDAWAARVGGVLTGYESSTPLVSRDLHFQNNLTGDVYLSPTHADGSFAAVLPPGNYSLRTETGAILMRSIMVGRAALDLGHISELAPYAPQRLWHFQIIAPALVTSPAPSTAYVATADTTPLPADASAVPKPEVNWSEAPMGPAGGPNAATGAATAPVSASHVASMPRPAGSPGSMNGTPPASPGLTPFYSQPEPMP